MSSEVDICNLALAHLGDGARVTAISPADGSAQAAQCARFYPIARDQLLEMHAWGFATRREDLALLDLTPPTGWSYAYSLPNLCIRALRLISPTAVTDPYANGLSESSISIIDYTLNDTLNSQDFVRESRDDGTQVIYTNVEDANLQYLVRVSDTTKFPPLFVTALSRLLASYLAGPIIKGAEGRAAAREQLGIFNSVDYGYARRNDANARQSEGYSTAQAAAINFRR